jgi:chemotaxis protein MotB
MLNRRQRHSASRGKTRIGQERWLVSYADFITLLFGFFVVLYAASQMQHKQGAPFLPGLAWQWQWPLGPPPTPPINRWQMPISTLPHPAPGDEALQEQLRQALTPWLGTAQAQLRPQGEWLDIDLDANWLFASGSAQPQDSARSLLALLAQRLAPLSGEVQVLGFTDNQPIRTTQFASNWALSAARAVAVVELLKAEGVAPERLSAVGMGEHHPVASNDSTTGRAQNRRVVLRIKKALAPAAANAQSSETVQPLAEGSGV